MYNEIIVKTYRFTNTEVILCFILKKKHKSWI